MKVCFPVTIAALAVKTTSAALESEWRTLLLNPETAPRIRAGKVARLAYALESVATIPKAWDSGG